MARDVRWARRPAPWAVGVAGLLCTAIAAVLVLRAPTVYWSQADVVFLTPGGTDAVNAFQVTQTDAIAMAGVVQREVMGGPDTRVASDDVTIVGQGLRSGTWVRLKNSGGQWTNNFDRAVLDVQVVETTGTGAAQRMVDALQHIDAVLEERQSSAGVDPARRYTVLTSPRSPAVRGARGDVVTALAVTVALGVGATAAATQEVARRRHRPDPAPRPA